MRVQLQEIDRGIVVNVGNDRLRAQILHANCLQIEQVRDRLGAFIVPEVVQLGGDQMRLHVLGPAGAQGLVVAVLDQNQLAGIENHAHVVVGEVVLLVARPAPLDLGHFVGFDVADDDRVVGVGHHELVLEDVYLRDVGGLIGANDGLVAGREGADNDLARGDVVELEFAFVLDLFHGNVVDVDRAAERAGDKLAAVVFPDHAGHGVVVLDVLDAGLLPLAALRVEVVEVVAVEVAEDDAVA